jgi:hypothetical protein
VNELHPTEREAIAKRQLEVDRLVGAVLQLPCFRGSVNRPTYEHLKVIGPLAAVYAGVQPLLKELLDPQKPPSPERERELRSILWEVLP